MTEHSGLEHGRSGPADDRARGGITRRRFVQAGVTIGGTAVGAGGLRPSSSEDDESLDEIPATHLSLVINGQRLELVVDHRASLLDVLREEVHLTGTKKGCDQGACGACTILLNGRRVTSCLALAVMHDEAEITTIEGLADGDQLHPLQQAFIDEDAFQCGYCTPGQILSGVACIQEGHTNSREEIQEWMSGNICRCGAYTNIVTAIEKTARTAQQG